MQIVLNLLVISLLCEYVKGRYYYNGKVKKGATTAQIPPWLGILRVMPFLEEQKADAISMILLVSEKAAIGSAEEISKISKWNFRVTSVGTFYRKDNIQWNCAVADYELHPEYISDTLNTLALVKLEPTVEQRTFLAHPLKWPGREDRVMDGVLNIGFTDRNKDLELSVYEMTYVTDADCETFYTKEKIDFPILWPANYVCYKCLNINETCVNDAGMALVTYIEGNWTLLGISVIGPGCSLPARFVEFIHYKIWIQLHIDGNTRRMMRRKSWKNVTSALNDEHAKDEDMKFFLNFGEGSVDMRPMYPYITQIVRPFNRCDEKDGVLIYAEKGYVNSMKKGVKGKVDYMLSHADLRYSFYSCLRVSINSIARTEVEAKIDLGFGMEDLDQLKMKIPMKHRNRKIKPKIIFLKDDWLKYNDMFVMTIKFRFFFYEKAEIHIEYWADDPSIVPLPDHEYFSRTTTNMTLRRAAIEFLAGSSRDNAFWNQQFVGGDRLVLTFSQPP